MKRGALLLVLAPLVVTGFVLPGPRCPARLLPSQQRCSAPIASPQSERCGTFAPATAASSRFVSAEREGTRRRSVAVPLEEGGAEGGKKKMTLLEKPFKGIINDIKRKLPHYKTDLKDGANLKGVAASFFLFFACLAPAVAFGGLLGKATQGQMGTMEMILATSYNGIAYALLSGQPLTIIGSTGPVLAFTLVLYRTSQRLGLNFLPLYSWVGIWTSLILFISSITSLSNIVKFFTRFTDEIFSLLISLIFIVEAVNNLTALFVSPLVAFPRALLSLLAAYVTFAKAVTLRKFRNSNLFTKRFRDTVADFAPTIGVATGCGVVALANAYKGVTLPTLLIPQTFSTTLGRPWLVNIFDLPVWARLWAFVPAVMSSVLLFMDQTITVRLVNSPGHHLKKGAGYHMDMLCISVLTLINSLLGLPWLVAATVRSLNHVKAVANMKKDEATGELKIESLMENRLTGLVIHALIGCSIIFFRPLLSQIPLAVLLGLFLFLGQSSLGGNQLWERVKLLVTDPSLRPKAAWAQKVPYKVSAGFTVLQLVCLAGMWGLKNSRIGILFPLLIAALAPIRSLIEKLGWFSKEHLEILDAEDE